MLPAGQLFFFLNYLRSVRLPFYPFIYPGTLYKPMDINDICKKIILILNKKVYQRYINLQGKKIVSCYELFEIICNQNNKLCLKIPTFLFKFFLPNFVKNLLYKSNFFQQFLNIKNFI